MESRASSASTATAAHKRPRECVSLKSVRRVNEQLADFYQGILQEQEAAAAAKVAEEAKAAADEAKTATVTGSGPATPLAASAQVVLKIGNTCAAVATGDGDTMYDWTVFVEPVEGADLVRSVTFQLHPTFTPNTTTLNKAPFELHRRGWGTFPVAICVLDATGVQHELRHELSFKAERTECVVKLTAKPAAPAGAGGTGTGAGAGAGHAAGAGAGAGSSSSRASGRAGGSKPKTGTTGAKSSNKTARRMPCMTGVSTTAMHGRLARAEWGAPLLVTYCDTEARPGYNTMKAHEYQDEPETLAAKVRVLADLIRRSKHCVAYTGAGISTASGINDYASKSKNSVATGCRSYRKKKKPGLLAEPTFAHYALTALFNGGHLKHWVQQNHDGLPQKAGFPQNQLNEIHGAWFDPSNPVVPMSGTLRSDLCGWMEEEEEAADLVLAMGTSLCGMNADRMVDTPSRKAAAGVGLGSIIVGLQRTQADEGCSLRFFCKIDELMLLLALEMGLRVPMKMYSMHIPNDAKVQGEPDTFLVPYDSKGRLVKGRNPQRTKWCLAAGTKVRVTHGPGKGFRGTIHRGPSNKLHSVTVATPCMREGSKQHGKGQRLYALGTWWIEAACRGEVPLLPIVNVA